ncbi:jg22777, partial [Pararge aegeria aegeria]
MLRVKLSKLRQVCATAFIARILKETKPIKRNIDKYSIEYLSKASKSTDSSSKDENSEKRKHIIDKCFAEKTPVLEDFQKNANDELLMKDNLTLYEGNTVDKPESSISKIFGKEKKSIEVGRNARIQDIAAKVEEVKLAHDIIHTKGVKDEATLLQNAKVESNPENSKVSILLQNINVQTTTGDMRDVENLSQNVGQLDKIPHEHLNATLTVSDALENTDLQQSAANIEKEKIAQHIVHIDKTPYVNIDAAKVEDVNIIQKESEIQQNAEIEAKTQTVDKEKLSQHVIHIDKAPHLGNEVAKINVLNATLSESVLNTTTARTEEEKLAQKIDHIDETPHVEAGVAKVEGFNVSPKVLGHEANPNLTVSEPSSDTFSEQTEQFNIDELAKKCLGKPDGDIDQILLKELKNISRANSIKLNFPKDDSSQKYFSQIFENKSRDNNNIVFDISATHLKQVLRKEIKDVTEMRMDKFYPFHLDTVPIVTTDTREDECNRNYSPDGIKNLLLDIPAVLDPYDMQAIPFYQYVTKENIELQELQQQDAPTRKPAKTAQETLMEAPMHLSRNAPMNEEVILSRDDLNLQEPTMNNELKELEVAETFAPPSEVEHSLKSRQTTALSESDVSKLLEYKNSLSVQGVQLGRINSNIEPSEFPTADTDTKSEKPSTTSQECSFEELQNATHTVLTTTPADPFGTGQNDSSQQNMPSSTVFHEGEERRTEQQTNTAISANQEPGEYFPTNHFNSFTDISIVQAEYLVTDNCVTYSGVFDSKMATISDEAYDTA